MMRLPVLLLMVCFLSCEQKESKFVQGDAEPADSTLVGSTQEITAATEVVAVGAPLPEVQILFAGTFHRDEVKDNVQALPWLGLFTDESGDFVLTETQIVAERVVDGMVDDEANGEKTGWEIGTAGGQHPAMLLTGGDFTEGKVEAGEVPAAIYPGDSVQLDFHGVHYLLYATGLSVIDPAAGVNHVSEYNLYVVRTQNGKSVRTPLVSHASFDDAMTSILWSGDIDRDGYLDFVIDMSSHYNQRLPTLLLSKPAKDSQVVVPVAAHSSVGC